MVQTDKATGADHGSVSVTQLGDSGARIPLRATESNQALEDRCRAAEKRLARIGFDLHDGPIQNLVALAEDLRHFRTQLGELATPDPRWQLIDGRLDDISARIESLYAELRELSDPTERHSLFGGKLEESVRAIVASYESGTGFGVDLVCTGNFTYLTDSQKIALVRIAQEALTNVKNHSRATEVRVHLAAEAGGSSLEIEDNGEGFDVESALLAAARNGRLGLVGMSERVELLGGSFAIESEPGGPTRLKVVLPRWRSQKP